MVRTIGLDADRQSGSDRGGPLGRGQIHVHTVAHQGGQNHEKNEQQEHEVRHGRHVPRHTDFVALAEVHPRAGSSRMSINSKLFASMRWTTWLTRLTKWL